MRQINQHANYRKGLRGTGWYSYRYGTKAEPKPIRILTGQKREHAVTVCADVLLQGKMTKFEHEAGCRHGLRSAFCLDGHTWAMADLEAAQIVSAALNSIGAVRPTWAQGQPEFTEVREDCIHCGRPIPEEAFGGSRKPRFCSDECRVAAFQEGDFADRTWHNHAYAEAHRAVVKSKKPARPCEQCGRQFRPLTNERFCSVACVGAHKRVPSRPCAHCGTLFHSKEPKKKFCSDECSSVHGFTTQFECRCDWCGDAFMSKMPWSKFCSKDHKRMAESVIRSVRTRTTIPLDTRFFDYFIARPAEASRPQRLTPEKFDELVGD